MSFRQTYYRDNTRLIELGNYLFYKEFNDRDFTFVINGEKISVHKLIVKYANDELLEKFTNWEAEGLKSVEITDRSITTRVFKIFIEWVYTGSFNYKDLNDQGVLQMLSLASEYGFYQLASDLADAVDNRSYLNNWNVWAFYKAASDFEQQSLHDSCVKFMDRHAIEALTSDACYQMSPVLYRNILGRDTLYAKEAEILKALLRYISEKQDVLTADEKRDLLGTIKWSLVTSSEFEEIVKPTGIVDEEFYNKAKDGKKEEERIDSTNPRPHISLR